MFGYVKPFVPELKVKEHTFYKAVYCGLCKCMGKKVSRASRLSLSYDFVFLALVRAGVTNEPFEAEMGRCMLHPLKKRAVIKTNKAVEYGAKAGALLTYYKIKDDYADGKGIKKIGSAFILPFAKRMKRKAKLPPEFENTVKEYLSELSETEKSKTPSIDKPAEIFGNLLSYISSYGIEDDIQSLALQKIGYHIGRWVYIIDAADDYEKDKKSGNYNPFVLGGGLNKDALFYSLEAELKNLDELIEKLDITDETVKNIIKNITSFGALYIEKSVIYKENPKDKLENI